MFSPAHSEYVEPCEELEDKLCFFLIIVIEIGFAEVEIWQQVWKLANQFAVFCASWFRETRKNEERLHGFG